MAGKKRWKRIQSMYMKGRVACTVLLAREYLEDFPDDPYAWIVLGASLTGLARFDEGRKALERAVRHLPDGKQDRAYVYLGHLFAEKGSLPAAERWYGKALEVQPDDPGYLILLGTCLQRQGKLDEARQHLARAAELDTSLREEAYLNLGVLDMTEDRYDAAIECFEKALEIDPKYKAAKRALADLKRWKKLAGNRE